MQWVSHNELVNQLLVNRLDWTNMYTCWGDITKFCIYTHINNMNIILGSPQHITRLQSYKLTFLARSRLLKESLQPTPVSTVTEFELTLLVMLYPPVCKQPSVHHFIRPSINDGSAELVTQQESSECSWMRLDSWLRAFIIQSLSSRAQ